MAPSLAGSWEAAQDTVGGGTSTTASFTPQTGDIIVVKAISATVADSVPGTPSGGGWAYTPRVTDTTASHCGCYLWTAPVTTGGTGQTVAITWTGDPLESRGDMIVELWRSAVLAGSPATCDARGTGASSTTIVTAAAGSAVSWANADWNGVDGASRTYDTTSAVPSETGYHRVAGAYGAYGAYQAAVSAGSQTIGLTAPTGQIWTLFGIELQAGGTSATVPMGSALAVATAQPASQLMSLSGAAYAASASGLGGGTGTWSNTGNADGAPDSSYATWAVV